jgi:transposase
LSADFGWEDPGAFVSYERAFGEATIQQAFRFELDPNRAQRVLLAKSVGASRYVYNWGLAESQRQYELTGIRPRLGDLKKQLVELKQTGAAWLYEVSAHIGQSALKDLNVAFERFFKSVKGDGPKAGYARGLARARDATQQHLALSVSDAGMSELRRQLAYKSAWYGSTLVIADRFFPSSKLCSGCGTIRNALSLNERVYECDVCALSLDRDEERSNQPPSARAGGTTGGSPGSDACGEEG